MEANPCTLKPVEAPQDLYWNYSREIVAMINSQGGLFVIGVSDENDHHVVPLESNDSGNLIAKEGLEAYIRKVIAQHLVPDNKKWTYKNRTFTTEERKFGKMLMRIDTSESISGHCQCPRFRSTNQRIHFSR